MKREVMTGISLMQKEALLWCVSYTVGMHWDYKMKL